MCHTKHLSPKLSVVYFDKTLTIYLALWHLPVIQMWWKVAAMTSLSLISENHKLSNWLMCLVQKRGAAEFFSIVTWHYLNEWICYVILGNQQLLQLFFFFPFQFFLLCSRVFPPPPPPAMTNGYAIYRAQIYRKRNINVLNRMGSSQIFLECGINEMTHVWSSMME